MFTILGHLGVWAGFYALAAFICFSQLAGTNHNWLLPRWEAMVCVLLTATAVYSIDRVKLTARWLDPADVAAQPERYGFLSPHNRSVRTLAFVLLLIAALISVRLSTLLPFVILAAAVSTALYAPMPRRKFARIKDRLWLKNAYVAFGMAGFAGLFALFSHARANYSTLLHVALERPLPLIIAFAVVALRIFFDAALCDMDDEATDRRFQTHTFATTLGSPRVWNWAGLGRGGLAVGMLFAQPVAFQIRVSWCVAMVLGMIALRSRHPVRIRDTVDVRFLPEAFLATCITLVWNACADSRVS